MNEYMLGETDWQSLTLSVDVPLFPMKRFVPLNSIGAQPMLTIPLVPELPSNVLCECECVCVCVCVCVLCVCVCVCCVCVCVCVCMCVCMLSLRQKENKFIGHVYLYKVVSRQNMHKSACVDTLDYYHAWLNNSSAHTQSHITPFSYTITLTLPLPHVPPSHLIPWHKPPLTSPLFRAEARIPSPSTMTARKMQQLHHNHLEYPTPGYQ